MKTEAIEGLQNSGDRYIPEKWNESTESCFVLVDYTKELYCTKIKNNWWAIKELKRPNPRYSRGKRCRFDRRWKQRFLFIQQSTLKPWEQNRKNAMKPRFSQNVNMFAHYSYLRRFHHSHRRTFSSFLNNIRSNNFRARASSLGQGSGSGGGGGTGDSKGNSQICYEALLPSWILCSRVKFLRCLVCFSNYSCKDSGFITKL